MFTTETYLIIEERFGTEGVAALYAGKCPGCGHDISVHTEGDWWSAYTCYKGGIWYHTAKASEIEEVS